MVAKEDYDNIQGDIWPGLSKRYEEFYFFSIEDVELFKPVLKNLADEVITSATHAMAARTCIQMVKAEEAKEKTQEHPKKNTRSNGGGLFGVLNDAVDGVGSTVNTGIDFAGTVAHAAVDVSVGVAKFPFDVIAHLVPKDAKDIPRSQASKSHASLAAVNISFTHVGMNKLWKVTFTDDIYIKGMQHDMMGKGRDQEKEWRKEFLKDSENSQPSKIDGMVLVCGTKEEVQAKVADLNQNYLGEKQGCRHVITLNGQERPGKQRGHEHFGFLDGVSQPLLAGFDDEDLKAKGALKSLTNPGVIIFGHDAEDSKHSAWARNGSIQVVRRLKQFVPEWNRYVEEQGAKLHLTPGQMGARMMGRWQSGAPVELYPDTDHPEHARFNDFDYDPESQLRCPFASHTRKVKPRKDVDNLDTFDIMRRGLPFGPEHDPATEPTTTQERGLMFVCYQTRLDKGFSFIKNDWCNNDDFPSEKVKYTGGTLPGQDPVIGQTLPSTKQADDTGLTFSITDGKGQHTQVEFPSFVESQGGDYFFTPSLSLLRTMSGVN
ncbi:hypothetical protein ACN38_g3115 [Penicillium nordicum]|uniref:Dyp-type peroxidase n=1 Tax=Penicillium nordicum TaxID=229535 RepID=A0A0M8PEA9_9EURO|nr:hypothetical protein ACN38_g3115 [Penicillium nordicum]